MPSPRAVTTADFNPSLGRALTPPQDLTTVTPDAGYSNGAMYKLSKRLWSIEVHRRLELQTRRALEA